MAEFRTATKGDQAELRAELQIEIKAADVKLTRWVVTCILGQTTVLASLAYFALTHLQR